MIVNIAAYHFTVIDDPPQLARQLREQAETLQLRGTALVAGEGINLFLAGPAAAIETLLDGLRADPRFQTLAVKYSHSQSQPFARLKVKVKREIIAFRRDQASPLQERAPTVTPGTLERWLDRGVDDDGRRVVLLDTRNREEVGYGSFEHALTLPIDNFTELPEALAPHREALRDATVVSFCTGGIRCEKAALWLRADGMDNVLQLDGGILGYFERVGGKHYQGHCFVFDERVALDPQLRPLRDAAA
ncbi:MULTISPECIES: sulfurtransferase [unclassified Lysobacter]|uniref:sulfurtransferase n=1 Tax=unclassified Lysobacter TaxID=2635362 RepID=UPI001BE9FCC3|nr:MULTISPECIES: sulfurtransferase [unclassified Lysobacter]MBT2747283.1 sulfurtransferase [Lysobacter sp. ISL-42]MBT2753329.1 sulfurtransferase [Lysobacter sp. ISL-50]MBT2775439.1 sulfurtransferase [Lysobacter sp. ISL-54]MBT2783025.1 sulfurtransferase [Lysobacter sp. ISL-52]